MAELHFKDCSEIFNPFIQKSKNLKIGLSAYKSYVDKQLLEFTKVIRSIYDDSPQASTDNGYKGTDWVTMTIERDGVRKIIASRLDRLQTLASGAVQEIDVSYCKPEINYFSGSTRININELNSFVADKVSCLQGQSLIFGAAIKQDLNASFDTQSILAEMSLRGFETSDYLQSITSCVTSGMTWADMLGLLTSGVKEPEVDEDGYWYFEPDDYSDTNSLVLGLTSITSTMASFFSNIKFDILKIGNYFKQLWKGITDLVTWILNMLAGDLFTDYVVKNDYTLEGLNVPIASVTCDIDQISTNSYVSELYADYLSNPDKFALCRGSVYASDNAYDQVSYDVRYLPNLSAVVQSVREDVKDGTMRVIPWSNGFILIVRKGNKISIYYFIGDFRSTNGFSKWTISSDGEISLSQDFIVHRDFRTTEFKRNDDFKAWFKSLLHARQDGAGYTVVTDNDFLGNGILGHTPTGYENYLDMSINPDLIDGPGSLIDQLDDYYFSTISSKLAAQLLLNGLVYNNIFTCDVVRGSIQLCSFSTNHDVYSVANFEQTSFLPYETNQMVNFKYHAQSDTERANEVVDLIKKIAIAAVAVGTAIAISKVTRAIKVKSYSSQLSANDAWRHVSDVAPEDRAAAIKAAYKAQRKANNWQKLGSLVGGKTINSSLTNTLAGISIPSINDSSSDLLYEILTGDSI